MPYVSDAQRGFFHANVGKNGITQAMVNEYDQASKGMKLPHRAERAKHRAKKHAMRKLHGGKK